MISCPVWTLSGKYKSGGVKLIFTGGHISLKVAFKGPNVILGLYKCNYSLPRGKDLKVPGQIKQGGGPDWALRPCVCHLWYKWSAKLRTRTVTATNRTCWKTTSDLPWGHKAHLSKEQVALFFFKSHNTIENWSFEPLIFKWLSAIFLIGQLIHFEGKYWPQSVQELNTEWGKK